MTDEEYLMEPTPLAIELTKELQDVKDPQQKTIATVYLNIEQQSRELIELIRDPKSHNSQTIVGMYDRMEQLSSALEQYKEQIDGGYEVGDTMINPNKFQTVEERIDWINEAIGGLMKTYGSDVKKYISRISKILTRYDH